jgi:hypothetical protein
MFWLAYDKGGRRYIVIEPASTLIFARMLAAMKDLENGTFIGGFALDNTVAKYVPKDMTGGVLSLSEAEELLVLFAPLDSRNKCSSSVLMSSPDKHGGWIENLRFSVELCRNETNLEEVVARMSDLTMARAAHDLAAVQWPLKLVKLCQSGRILRRSDRQ